MKVWLVQVVTKRGDDVEIEVAAPTRQAAEREARRWEPACRIVSVKDSLWRTAS